MPAHSACTAASLFGFGEVVAQRAHLDVELADTVVGNLQLALQTVDLPLQLGRPSSRCIVLTLQISELAFELN